MHRSFCAENPGEESNERLEFLGDAVLGVVVTAYLYTSYPALAEGDLARIKAAVVSSEALAPIARRLSLGDALLVGKGEEMSGGRDKASLLADCLEAIIGAIFLDGGLDGARSFVLSHLGEQIDLEASRSVLGDPKNVLQEEAFRLGHPAPSYRLKDKGPEHAKLFIAEVDLGELTGAGEGRSKKEAERRAAFDVLRRHRGDEAFGHEGDGGSA